MTSKPNAISERIAAISSSQLTMPGILRIPPVAAYQNTMPPVFGF
jgi:hypothetical protein